MAKIATLLSNLFEDSEYFEPAKEFEAKGHNVVTIEKEAGVIVTGKKRGSVEIDIGIDDVSHAEFDALLLPGGYSPDILRADDHFVKFTKEFMDSKKPVFAICHGQQLLITAKALAGRDATGYKSIQVDMEYAGARFLDQAVVVCQNQLVTSRTPADMEDFIREALTLLGK